MRRRSEAVQTEPRPMLYAVVPVNELKSAKSRLRGLSLDLPSLVLDWARQVVTTLVAAPSITRVALVSPDPKLSAYAQQWGAHWLRQLGGGLNDGLELGRRWAVQEGADELLLALGDLPLLQVAEIEAMIARPGSVIAPDREGQGTNLLLLRPVNALELQFGQQSFSKHSQQARARSLTLTTFRSHGSERDVDEPEHLRQLPLENYPRAAGRVLP